MIKEPKILQQVQQFTTFEEKGSYEMKQIPIKSKRNHIHLEDHEKQISLDHDDIYNQNKNHNQKKIQKNYQQKEKFKEEVGSWSLWMDQSQKKFKMKKRSDLKKFEELQEEEQRQSDLRSGIGDISRANESSKDKFYANPIKFDYKANQLSQESQQVQKICIDNNSTSQRKCSLFSKLFISLAFIFVVLVIFSYSCSIFELNCHKKIATNELILNRKIKNNQCFVFKFCDQNWFGIDQDKYRMRTNGTIYFCVKSERYNGDIQMIAYLKKISEEDLSQSQPRVRNYLTDRTLETPLIYSLSQGKETQSSIAISDDEREIELKQEDVQRSLNGLTIFRFTVSRKGKLKQIQVNKQIRKEILGKLTIFIEMFFPPLTSLLYQSNSIRQQEIQGTKQSVKKSRSQNYQTEVGSNGGVILIRKVITQPGSSSLFGNQQRQTKSQFDKNGDFLTSQMRGFWNLSSPLLPKLKDVQSYELNNSVIFSRQIKLDVIQVMKNLTKIHIQRFQEYFISNVVKLNRSKSLYPTQISEFLLNGSFGVREKIKNGTSAEINSAIYKKDQTIALLNLNMMGIEVNVQGVTFLKIYENLSDEFRRQSIIELRVAIRTIIGSYIYQKNVFETRKIFEPLSFKFTLQKLKQIMKLKQEAILDHFSAISKLESIQTYNSLIVPYFKILKIQLQETVSLIFTQKQKMQNSFESIILKIKQFAFAVDDAEEQIQQRLQIVNNFTLVVSEYVDKIFTTLQSEFKIEKDHGDLLVIQFKTYSVTLYAYIEQIDQLMTHELQERYQAQKNKLQLIESLYEQIRNKTDQISDTLSSYHSSSFNSIRNMFQILFQNFYEVANQTLIKILQRAQIRNNQLEESSNQMEKRIYRGVEEADKFLQSKLEQLPKVGVLPYLNQLYFSFQNIIGNFLQIAEKIRANFTGRCGGCQAYFWNIRDCPYYNTLFSKNAQTILRLPQHVLAMKKDVDPFTSSVKEASDTLKQIQTASKNLSVEERYAKLSGKSVFMGIQAKIKSLQLAIQQLKSKLQLGKMSTFNWDCGFSNCCQEQWMRAAHQNYQMMLDTIIGVSKVVDDFSKKIEETLIFLKTITQFDSMSYKEIKSLIFKSGRETLMAFKLYYEDILFMARKEYDKIISTKDQMKESYLKGFPVQEKHSESFNNIVSWTKDLCFVNQAQRDLIIRIRSDFSRSNDEIKMIQNLLIREALANISNIFIDLRGNAFQEQMQKQSCDSQDLELIDKIQSIQNDIFNFYNIEMLINQTNNQIMLSNSIRKEIKQEQQTIVWLTSAAYNSDTLLALLTNYTELFQKVFDEQTRYMIEVQNIKNQMNVLYNFSTVKASKIAQIIAIFYLKQQHLSNKSYVNKKISAKHDQISQSLEFINYNFLGTYRILRSASQMIIKSIQLLQNGQQYILKYLQQMELNLANISQGIAEESIIELKVSLSQIQAYYMSKISFQIQQKMDLFSATFTNLIANDSNMQSRIKNVKKITNKFQDEFKNEQAQFIEKFSNLTEKCMNLLQNLKISYINQIIQIRNQLLQQFSYFNAYFSSSRASLINYFGNISENYDGIIGASDFLVIFESELQQQFKLRLSNIKKYFQAKVNLLSKDDQIKSSFLELPSMQNITNITQVLQIDFRVIWSNFSESIKMIEQFQDQDAQNMLQTLQMINELSYQLQKLPKLIDGGIFDIQNSYRQINENLYIIRDMNISSLDTKIRRINEDLKQINENKNDIEEKVLNLIENATKIIFPLYLNDIKEQLLAIHNYQNSIRQNFDIFESNLQNQIFQFQNFTNSSLVQEFETILTSKSILQAKSIAPQNSESYQIDHKSQNAQSFSFENKSFNILGEIGVATFEFGGKISLTSNVKIQILETRNMRISISYNTDLTLEALLSFGQFQMLKIGSSLEGHLLEAQLNQTINVEGFLPVPLIKQMKGIQQFLEMNQLTIYENQKIQFFQSKIELGQEIKVFQPEIYWYKYFYCYETLSTERDQNCFSFKLPIILTHQNIQKGRLSKKGIAMGRYQMYDTEVFRTFL